jgi:23S rRNA (guanosine2251-2'-O)-methyltransferase
MQAIIAGRKPVMEALRAGTSIEEIRQAAQRNKVPVSQSSRQEFRELASDATTQGVVAIVRDMKTFVGLDEIVRRAEAKGEKPLVLLLDGIEDPQNLGALVRTAECAGVHGVVIPKHHAASVTAAVVKASAGATEHMAMAEVTNIVNTLDELKERGLWTAGVALEGDIPYTAFDYTTPAAIVVGNEGKGIRRLVREHCDRLVRIPMYGAIESLNASVAGALVMYEAAKQRHA